VAERALEEGQVLRRELVLQRLRRSGDDRLVPGDDRGDEVGECLSGARAGLHEEVSMRLDGVGDCFRHLALAFSAFASARDRSHYAFERGTDRTTLCTHRATLGRR
jgi:hypothetical protein